MALTERRSMYSNTFLAQVKNNRAFASFILIIRTTLIASTILVVMHVGAYLTGDTGLKDRSLLRNKDFLIFSHYML